MRRIGQGMPPGLGSGAAPKTGIFSAVSGAISGSKARTAVKAAAPVFQGAAQSVGQGIGAGVGWAAGNELVARPIKGIIGLFLNIIPENLVGIYVLVIMLVYWVSWLAGFAATPVLLGSHFALAVLGFFMLVYVENREGKGTLWQIARRNGVTFSIIMIIDYMLLTGHVQWNLVLVAALLLAFKDGSPVQDFKRVVIVMLIASTAYYFYNHAYQLIIPSLAKIASPFNFTVWSLNFGYLPFVLALLVNRTVTYPFFWFAIFGLSSRTRVANSLAWIIMFLFIFASWPVIAPEVNRLHDQYVTGATAEQKAFWPNLFKQAGENFKGAVSSFSALLVGKTEAAYASTEQAFGFGQPKEEPKSGLQLLADRNMPKVFDYAYYPAPAPSVVMSLPTPLPLDLNHGAIDVVNIACLDKQGKSTAQILIEPATPLTTEAPLSIVYKRPRTAKCELTGLTKGSYTAEIKVSYKFHSNANFFTTFMRMDKLNEIVAAGLDPAVVNKIPSARAVYDNGPVAVTWGPVELTNSPASVDIDPAKDPDNPNANIVVFVAKSPTWEGEIGGITELNLTVPEGVKLVTVDEGAEPKTDNEKRCLFEKVKDMPNVYRVKKSVILIDVNKPSNNFTNLRLVGESVQFSCKMKVTNAVLGGFDSAGAEFKTSMDYFFTTKKSVSFEVKGECPTCTTTTGTCAAYGTAPVSGQSCCSGYSVCVYCGLCYNSCPNSLCKGPGGATCISGSDCVSGLCSGSICSGSATAGTPPPPTAGSI